MARLDQSLPIGGIGVPSAFIGVPKFALAHLAVTSPARQRN
jgi:hypothetical protein